MTLKLPFLLKRPQKYHSIKKSKESEAEKDGQKEAEKESAKREMLKAKMEKKDKKRKLEELKNLRIALLFQVVP